MMNAGFVLLGIISGVLSGLLGIGGGVVIIPALTLIFGLTQHNAQGTTLGLFLFPVSFLAVLSYAKQDAVNWWAVLFIGLGFLAGSVAGSLLVFEIPDEIVKRAFGVLLILLGLRMVIWA